MPAGGEHRARIPVGRRRADGLAPGRRRAGRLRELLIAGLVDSFGLSLGWTLFSLIAVVEHGLAMAATYNAAMLVGVVLSAPVAGLLAGRLDGRAVLRVAAGTEAVLRVLTLVGLLAGWPAPVVVVGVVVMHVAAWTGFAAMRAEVSAADDRPRAMTRYLLCIAAVEASGAGIAALIPLGDRVSLADPIMVAVVLGYGACLLPTIVSARRARVRSGSAPQRQAPRGSVARVRVRARPPVRVLAAGGLIAAVATGPTLLAVALTTELYGREAVVGAAVAFSVGCLLSSAAVDLMGRLRLPATLSWPLWGIGMLAGWALAPWHVAGLFVAQLLAGLSMTAFEGVMDARVAQRAAPGTVTASLAWSAASRAFGGAAAVRTLPVLVAAPAVGLVSLAGTAVLALAALVGWLVTGGGRGETHPAHPPEAVARVPEAVARVLEPVPGGAGTTP